MTAKTATARVIALRERRAALGLTRLELYAHPNDHAAIKAHAEKLAKKRAARKSARLACSIKDPQHGKT